MRKKPTAAEVVQRATQLINEGKVRISNKAFHRGPDSVVVRPLRNGLVFEWSRDGVGFGGLELSVTDGKLHVDNEGMGLEFCIDVILQALLETEPFKPKVPK